MGIGAGSGWRQARCDGRIGRINRSPGSTLLPAAIVLLFSLALFAVSARIWLPGDMAAPAPIS
jgi:hypothetical protein